MNPRPSAGGILVTPDKKLVLVEQHGNSWSFPKGGIEASESALEAAKREIYEETGIAELELVEELGTYERYSLGPDGTSDYTPWGLRKRTIFLFRTAQKNFSPMDGEVTRVGVFDFDEALKQLTHPKDKEFLASVHSRIEKYLL